MALTRAARAGSASSLAALCQLGDGTTTQRTTPIQVGTATTWASLAASGSHTCGTRTDATAWCWGYNGTDQLGFPLHHSTPQAVLPH